MVCNFLWYSIIIDIITALIINNKSEVISFKKTEQLKYQIHLDNLLLLLRSVWISAASTLITFSLKSSSSSYCFFLDFPLWLGVTDFPFFGVISLAFFLRASQSSTFKVWPPHSAFARFHSCLFSSNFLTLLLTVLPERFTLF